MKLRYKLLILLVIVTVAFVLFVGSAMYTVLLSFSQTDSKTNQNTEDTPINNSNICSPLEVTGERTGNKITLTFSGAFSASKLKGTVNKDGTFSIEDTGDASTVRMALPSSPARLDFFSYMPQMDQSLYGIMLDQSSKQYQFNQLCYNDSAGFRRYGEDYLIALGSYYGTSVGKDRYRLKFKDDEGNAQVITAVLGDVKADSQTDSTHRYHAKNDNTVLEFIMADRDNKNNRVINDKFGTLVSISKIGMDIELKGSIKAGEISISGKCNKIDFTLSGNVKDGKVSASGFYGNGSGIFLWPCDSSTPITDTYGWRMHPIWNELRLHEGIDFGVSIGSNIYASAAGEVTLAGTYGGYGEAVIIAHSNGFSTLYAHNSTVLVSVGDTVSAGQRIAYSGNSGNSTGPHLHFEILKNGTATDPMPYLSKRSDSDD